MEYTNQILDKEMKLMKKQKEEEAYIKKMEKD